MYRRRSVTSSNIDGIFCNNHGSVGSLVDSLRGRCNDGRWLRRCGGHGGGFWQGSLNSRRIGVRCLELGCIIVSQRVQAQFGMCTACIFKLDHFCAGPAPSSTNSTTAAAMAVATGCWIAVLVSRSAATSCDAEHLSTRSSSSAGTRGHCAVCQAGKRAFCADFLWSNGIKKGRIESIYLQPRLVCCVHNIQTIKEHCTAPDHPPHHHRLPTLRRRISTAS